jgi:inhibitor of cysteine peptidase
MVQVLAPIESVEVLVMESFPPRYSLTVVSGLPNGCASFAGYRLERSDDTVLVEMVNWKPADPQVACSELYRIVETRISLGSEFESGRTYTLLVNDVTESFVAQ